MPGTPESKTSLVRVHSLCRPGLMTSQFVPESPYRKGYTSSLVGYAAESEFYSAVEIALVTDPRERAAIAKLATDADLRVTYWLTKPLQDAKLSLCCLDETERQLAVKLTVGLLSRAAECGSSHAAIQSGPDVPIHQRAEAKQQLHRSICQIFEAMEQYPDMRLLIEPTDRDAFTKYLIGPVGEAVAFTSELRESVPTLDLGLDTAHVVLQKEDPVHELSVAASVTSQLHLANCIGDPDVPGFGDRHLPPGPPGYLTEDYVRRILLQGLQVGFFGPARPILSVEIVGPGGDESWELERASREMMLLAWQTVLEHGL